MPAVKYTKWPINFFRAYAQFSVWCECWEQSEINQRNKRIGSGVGVAWKNISSGAPSFCKWETEAQRGKDAHPRPHSWKEAERGWEPRTPAPHSVPICSVPSLPHRQENCCTWFASERPQHLSERWRCKQEALSRQPQCPWDQTPAKPQLCFILRQFTGSWYSYI